MTLTELTTVVNCVYKNSILYICVYRIAPIKRNKSIYIYVCIESLFFFLGNICTNINTYFRVSILFHNIDKLILYKTLSTLYKMHYTYIILIYIVHAHM